MMKQMDSLSSQNVNRGMVTATRLTWGLLREIPLRRLAA
jgi:hypothetical protein